MVAWGPDISPGAAEKPFEMTDVAPTILHLLGLPVPSDMDGQARVDILTPAAARRPVEHCEPQPPPRRSFPPPVEADLTRRLRAVGYLE